MQQLPAVDPCSPQFRQVAPVAQAQNQYTNGCQYVKRENSASGKLWEIVSGKSRYTGVQGSTGKYSNLLILCGAQEETRTLTPRGAGT